MAIKNKRSGANTARRQGGKGKPFVKGDVRANVSGQRNAPAVAMTKSFRDVLVMIGGEPLVSELSGKPISKKKIEWLGYKLWAMALAGDMAAIKELLDRTEGKVSQPLEHTGADGKPLDVLLKIIHTHTDGKEGGGNGNGNGDGKAKGSA
jgi:hypothetical protein